MPPEKLTMLKPMILSALLMRAMLFVVTVSGVAVAAEFRAGAGKNNIQTSADMWPVDGFTSQHDPLAVRVLLLDDSRTRAAIVVVDQTSISEGSIAKIKALLTKLTGVSAENTIVVASQHLLGSPCIWRSPRCPQSAESGDRRFCNCD
jgi:hypothetical protein